MERGDAGFKTCPMGMLCAASAGALAIFLLALMLVDTRMEKHKSVSKLFLFFKIRRAILETFYVALKTIQNHSEIKF